MERTRANEELARRRRQVHFHFNDDDDDDELRTQRQQQWHKWTYQREWLKWTLGAVVWRLRGALWLASSLAPPLVQLIGSLDAAAGRPHALAALSIVPSRPGTHTRPGTPLFLLAFSFLCALACRSRALTVKLYALYSSSVARARAPLARVVLLRPSLAACASSRRASEAAQASTGHEARLARASLSLFRCIGHAASCPRADVRERSWIVITGSAARAVSVQAGARRSSHAWLATRR